jgi:hypothetical protein
MFSHWINKGADEGTDTKGKRNNFLRLQGRIDSGTMESGWI